jgi:hypothetical protein
MITEKDVYGQEPIFIINPHNFEYIDNNYKETKTTTIMNLKPVFTVLRSAAFVAFAGAVAVTTAKIVVTYAKFIWGLW